MGCHKGTIRPLGNVANEVLRLKRIETHQIFDDFWRRCGMNRTQAYKWLADQMHIPHKRAHIGGFEMDDCARVIELCQKNEKEVA